MMDPMMDPSGLMLNPNAPPPSHMVLLQNFWQSQLQAIDQGELDFKTFQLPLARIKKVMKTDEDVKMISAEAPIIFAKACEIFILELTLRAWIHTEDSKRRTLQRNDVAAAIAKTDTFDFLIDIVPREDTRALPKKLDHEFRGPMMGEQAAPFYYAPQTLGSLSYPSNMAGDPRSMDPMLYYQQQQQQYQQMQYMRQMQGGAGGGAPGGPLMHGESALPTGMSHMNGTAGHHGLAGNPSLPMDYAAYQGEIADSSRR